MTYARPSIFRRLRGNSPSRIKTFNLTSLPGDRAHPIHVGDHAGMSTGGFALTPTAKYGDYQ